MVQGPSEDLMQPPQDMQDQTQQEEPPTLVPALWAAVIGRASPDVETIQFFVDDATADAARHWARRKEEFRLVIVYLHDQVYISTVLS